MTGLKREKIDEIKQKKKEQNHMDSVGIEQAYELVEKADEKINNIGIVLRGIDKRMSYNLRMIGSIT